MAIKGQKFTKYSEEAKMKMVQSYLNGEGSYKGLAKQYGLKSSTQLKMWVKKYLEKGNVTDLRGTSSDPLDQLNPLKGHRIHFRSVEEERDYYKAQVEYLKKRYP